MQNMLFPVTMPVNILQCFLYAFGCNHACQYFTMFSICFASEKGRDVMSCLELSWHHFVMCDCTCNNIAVSP